MFKLNEYFDGKVKSLSFDTGDCPATVGVIAPGEYAFNTSTKEIMTVISGKMNVCLPDSTEWVTYLPGETFTVATGKQFSVKTEIDTAYYCLYL